MIQKIHTVKLLYFNNGNLPPPCDIQDYPWEKGARTCVYLTDGAMLKLMLQPSMTSFVEWKASLSEKNRIKYFLRKLKISPESCKFSYNSYKNNNNLIRINV